jgi:hypothetical protein
VATFWSGNGGSIVVGATTLNIGKWTLRKGARLVENTHSGTPSTNYEKVVPDNSGTIDVPWDSTNIPDSGAGLISGAKVTLVFNLGASGKFHTLTNTSIEVNEDTDDNAQDIIRTSVSFKGGTLTLAS